MTLSIIDIKVKGRLVLHFANQTAGKGNRELGSRTEQWWNRDGDCKGAMGSSIRISTQRTLPQSISGATKLLAISMDEADVKRTSMASALD